MIRQWICFIKKYGCTFCNAAVFLYPFAVQSDCSDQIQAETKQECRRPVFGGNLFLCEEQKRVGIGQEIDCVAVSELKAAHGFMCSQTQKMRKKRSEKPFCNSRRLGLRAPHTKGTQVQSDWQARLQSR